MTFYQKLDAAVEKNCSLLCVGLDNAKFSFNKSIIDATHDLVCAYKPNTAFFEADGADGIKELKKTCTYLHVQYPDIPIILDAKRGDISGTNESYASFAFDYLEADAITLHPYVGSESLLPFLNRKGKGCIILCRTSNPGAGELQDLMIGDKPLYQVIAEKVVNEWNTNGNCALVVGATFSAELKIVRRIVGDAMPLLVPGIGMQGGDLENSLKNGLNSKKKGLIINSSRSIIFATHPRTAAMKLREEINQYRALS